jgi:prepilin-type N-terminal cleavage/methylation domain-containing protein/prepilin-type processing-associated H-X9-DG protein
MPACHKSKAGFTLVELLAVMAIIAILISLLLPAVNAVRERARSTACSSNMRNIALAMLNYESSHKVFPINWGTKWDQNGKETRGHSWVTLILPQLEQEPLYKRIKFGERLVYRESGATIVSGRDNTLAAQQVIPVLRCASDTHRGLMENQRLIPKEMVGVSNYKACMGGNWNSDVVQRANQPPIATKGRYTNKNVIKGNPWDYNNGVIPRGANNVIFTTSTGDIKDGASNTIAIGETVPAWDSWSAWYGWNCAVATTGIPLNWDVLNRRASEVLTYSDRYWFFSRHSGGANFAFADGSGHWLSSGIDRDTYIGLGSIDGEEVLTEY